MCAQKSVYDSAYMRYTYLNKTNQGDADMMTAEFYNAEFSAKKCPLIAHDGKRTVKFFQCYEGSRNSGYSIGRAQAIRIAKAYDIEII